MKKERFGEYLVKNEALLVENVRNILDVQRYDKSLFGHIAVNLGILSEPEMMSHLSLFLKIPLLDLESNYLDESLASQIPKKMALRAQIFPVYLDEQSDICCACIGPINTTLLQNISRIFNKQIKLYLTTQQNLKSLQNSFYIKKIDTSINIGGVGVVGVENQALIEMVEKILVRAINSNATDIHFEADLESYNVRFRIDGELNITERLPLSMSNKIVSRIKILSKMDISEKRKPQDGACFFVPSIDDLQTEGVNLRVSVLPTIRGEKVVIRILPPHDKTISLEQIGMESDMKQQFQNIVSAPHGIILVTGPTGSGKSTTLYGALNLLRSESTNITTIEDPVEIQLKGINQTQIDGGHKITFATALKAILRQDPDIIMVGEIRDSDTINTALQAAITGHLVLSTLHTNDSVSTFYRLLDMGAEEFLIASATRGILAQRLVRKVCTHCSKSSMISQRELQMLGIPDVKPFLVKRSCGCDACDNKGYTGRVGIFELLIFDEEVIKLLRSNAHISQILNYVKQESNFRTLREDGILKVRGGVTTTEEIMRVTLEQGIKNRDCVIDNNVQGEG